MAVSRPEPMNATTHHSKVKVSTTLASPVFVAGGNITGKMEMECRADKGLGIGVMMVELFAIQELTSRDHSATSTFLSSRRLFQGPGLPPSNAVQPHPVPGEPLLPSHYHQARRGKSTFLFKFPLPSSSPSSINFGGDLARVRYELRASVGVVWKGEKLLVTDRNDLQVVECFAEEAERPEVEGVVVGENGKIWAQGRIVGGVIVAGESACIELQVKNHSTKKNSGLVVTLTRSLVLSGIAPTEKSPLQISDTLLTVPFRGQEYIIPPGAEGVASLVFDVPKHARGVKGGLYKGDESSSKHTPAIFEVKCVVGIKMTMGFGSKDIELDLPVTVVHPSALPELPPPPQQYEYTSTPPLGYQPPYADPRASPYGGYPALPMSPPIPTAYADPQQTHVWLPPQPYQYYSPPVPPGHQQQHYFFPPPPTSPVYQPLPLNLARPLSAGGHTTNLLVPGQLPVDAEEGKGERASRITQHLRQTTRNRSASPLSHRYPLPTTNPIPIPQTMHNVAPMDSNTLAVSPAAGSGGAVISPRPVLSPKASFADPATPKSERVEELERMAEAVALKTSNLSGDLPRSTLSADTLKPAKEKRRKSKSPSKRSSKRDKVKEKGVAELLAESDINKTLPGPPVPTGKIAPPSAARARVDTYFDLPAEGSPTSAQLTPRFADEELGQPKTPTLTAMRRPGLLTSESGLDALERRLLVEVGTRKMPAPPRPDVRSVVAAPVDIPAKRPDSAVDSAISSLTLAGGMHGPDRDRDSDERDRDSDERTQGPKKSSSGRTERGDGERRSGRKKEKEKAKEGEPRNMRKAAKGRVAAWLGGIDPEAPPDVDHVSPSPDIEAEAASVPPADGAVSPIKAAVTHVEGELETIVPNPRSSGFVPVNTFKRDPFQRIPAGNPADEAKRIAELWSATAPVLSDKSAASPRVTSPTRVPQSVHTNRDVSPPSSPPKANSVGGGLNGWKPVLSPAAVAGVPKKVVAPSPRQPVYISSPSSPPKANAFAGGLNGWKPVLSSAAVAEVPKKIVAPSPRLPAFPPRLDPEVKYDIRSARGGRGGKVTAVASLWATGALTEPPKDAAPKPATAVDFLRSKPVPKPAPDPVSKPAPAPVSTARPTPTSTPKPAVGGRTTGAASTPAAKPLDKPTRPIIKSASVPAVISSSHARPTLSSTASLARPSPKPRAPPKPAPTITESASEVVAGLKGRVQASMSFVPAKAPTPTPSGSKPGDLAFGQAKLRDLIKKYQGQAAA
ncbi:hypothetical protein B0H15DRAFT_871713 [Mycena belliarum]|uniref:Arrestin-like N-terminal domain-containing protein n=1 Tax=Mycena belliarum TaxID=1033014 RepID=A0AAD6TRI6_9AGAR|nr:hypothetical protein B0H15DRAFT_871713 [Mycena belliae]